MTQGTTQSQKTKKGKKEGGNRDYVSLAKCHKEDNKGVSSEPAEDQQARREASSCKMAVDCRRHQGADGRKGRITPTINGSNAWEGHTSSRRPAGRKNT